MSKSNFSKVDWDKYRQELNEIENEVTINRYATDLHTMTVKEGLEKDVYLCPAYQRILKDMKTFDQIAPDYFAYEKELKIGEHNS